MPRWPPEVLEHILDSTGDEEIFGRVPSPRLSAYSLVCKDWRPVAQSLLFKKLDFPVSRPLSRIATFLKAAPHISTHVRSLRIWRYEHDRKHQGCGIQPHILYKLLVALPRLQELDLFRVVLLGWKNTARFPMVPVKLHSLVLTDLEIDFHATKHPAAKAFDFLRLFDAAKMHVAGGALPWSYSNPYPPVDDILAVPGVPLPAVRELQVFGQSLFMELNDGNGGLNPTHISSFSMEPTQGEQLPFYGRFIRRYSETIRHLSLHISWVLYRMDEPEIADIQWESLNIASCTQLKSLRLHWTHDGYHSGEQQDARIREGYRAILSSTSAHLHELSLVVGLNKMQAPAAPFAQIAPYIAPVLIHGVARFNDLQSITLEISEHLDLEKSAAVMKALLPKSFVDRQLLHFKAHHEAFCMFSQV